MTLDRFQYDSSKGLTLVMEKHGTHDQKTHGSWADGYTDEEISRMEEMEDVGPSIEDLDAALKGAEEPGLDDLKLIVSNDRGLYERAIEGIEARVDAAFEETKYEYEDIEARDKANEDLRNRLYEKIQEEMIDEFVEFSAPGELAGLWVDQNGGTTAEDLNSSFSDLYGTSHEVRNADGEVVTVLSAMVGGVEYTTDTPTGEGIEVTGIIEDSDNNFAGEFKRTFHKEDGVWIVEHALLKLEDEYENLGFGKEFIQKSMDWYAQRGMGAVIVNTAWDGARHWARSGFDFQPEMLDNDLNELVDRVANNADFDFGTPARAEFDAIMRRATNGYVSDVGGVGFDSIKDMKTDDFPLPNDFAMIGFDRKTSTPYVHPITQDNKNAVSWAGERLLSNMNLHYVQILTPEGRNLFDGPIDRDGDGMVFDGTAREKPASAVNS
jgi:hypothetical protein